ncbi:hypothetical protein MMC10_005501 [Thelotrema lepadinum]|nr:hypothetical protein [Thelotrema lepadinum]
MSAGLLIGGHVGANATGEELTEAQRWLWGGGLAVGYFTLWILALLFKDMDPKGKLLIPKLLRVLPRLISALIVVLLPLASSEQLSDTGLLSIAAAVSAFTVVWETAGSLEKGACTFENWHDRDHISSEEAGDPSPISKEP